MIHVVFVRDANRWIDSMWYSRDNASTRVKQLTAAAKDGFNASLSVWIVSYPLEDAKLTEAPQEALKG